MSKRMELNTAIQLFRHANESLDMADCELQVATNRLRDAKVFDDGECIGNYKLELTVIQGHLKAVKDRIRTLIDKTRELRNETTN